MTIKKYDEVSIDIPNNMDAMNNPDDIIDGVTDKQSCDIRWKRIIKTIIITTIILIYLVTPGIIIGILNIYYDIPIWATLIIAFSPIELIVFLWFIYMIGIIICDIERTDGCVSDCIKYYCGYECNTAEKIGNIIDIVNKFADSTFECD